MSRAVSNVIGYAVLLTLLFVAITGLMLGGGAETVGTLQQQAQASAGESGLVDLATATEAIASNTAQQRRVSIAPRSPGTAQVAANSTLELTVVPTDGSPQTVYETDMGSIRYTDGDATGRFEGGGVWMTTDNVGRRIVAPPIDYQQSSSGTATLSVAPVTLDEQSQQLGSRFRIRQSTSSAARYTPASSSNPITTGTLRLTVTTTIPSMWEQYLDQTTPATVSTSESTVTAAFTPPDTAPSPDGAIRLTGAQQTRIDAQDRLITGNSPDKPLYQEGLVITEDRSQVDTNKQVILTPGVTVSGDVSTPDDVIMLEESEIRGDTSARDVVVNRNASVTGDVSATRDVTGKKDSTIEGSLDASGNISLGNGARVGSDTDGNEVVIGDNAEITGDTTTSADVKIGSQSDITGDVDSSGAISVDDRSQVGGDMSASSGISLGNKTQVGGNVDAQSVTTGEASTVQGSVTASRGITLAEQTTITGAVDGGSGDILASSGVTVKNDISTTGGLNTGENSTLTGDISTTGETVVGTQSNIGGDIDSSSRVSIGAETQVTGSVSASAIVTLASGVTVTNSISGSKLTTGDSVRIESSVDVDNGTQIGSQSRVTSSISAGSGPVVIGDTSRVDGDVTGSRIQLGNDSRFGGSVSTPGRVLLQTESKTTGDIDASKDIVLKPDAVVTGDVSSGKEIIIGEDAQINGDTSASDGVRRNQLTQPSSALPLSVFTTIPAVPTSEPLTPQPVSTPHIHETTSASITPQETQVPQVSDKAEYQADVQSRGPVVVTESSKEVAILGTLFAPRISTVGEGSVDAIDQTEQPVTSQRPSITGQLAAVAKQFSANDLRSTGQQRSGGTIDKGTTRINGETVVTGPITVTDDATLVISDTTDGSRSPVRIDGQVSATDGATIIIDTRDSNTTFAPTELHLSDDSQVVIRGDNHADIITSQLTLADQSSYRFATGATATTGIYVRESVILRDSTEIGAGRVFPNQVWLYAGDSITTRSATQVTVTGVVYAPDADLTVNGDTRVDGAVIARSLELKQSTLEVQYDVVLETETPFTARNPPTGTLRVYATETPVTTEQN